MRWYVSWLAGFVLLAMLVSGCQQDSREAVQVLGAAPASTAQPAPGQTPVDSAPTPTENPGAGNPGVGNGGNPGVGNGGGGSASPTGPGGDNPGPGTGPGDDGFSGPVDGTGASDDGPGIAPGEGDRLGGLRLLAPTPPFAAVANEVYDLCDDQDAYVAVFARALKPGEEITDDERHDIIIDRIINEVSCDEPGGRRYVYMSNFGPSGAFATAQDAVEDHKARNPFERESRIVRPPDIPLGYFGHLDWTFPLEDIDEVVLVEGSVLVRDGVVRGLVRNLSKTLFAREVTVTARPVAGKESENNNAQAASGRFPLTVQPGERAPFEINGWAGSDNPADIELEVTANLSTNVDITRSFGFGTGGTITTRAIDEEIFRNFVPRFVYQAEKHKIPDDGRFNIEYISAGLAAPTSHPSLTDQVLNQTIEDLRVYMALIGNGKVHDIVEPPLYVSALSAPHPHYYPQVVSIPTYYRGFSHDGFDITFIPTHSWHMWVGEPGPLDFNPRTLPDPPEPSAPPTLDPDWAAREQPQPTP